MYFQEFSNNGPGKLKIAVTNNSPQNIFPTHYHFWDAAGLTSFIFVSPTLIPSHAVTNRREKRDSERQAKKSQNHKSFISRSKVTINIRFIQADH